MTRTVYVVSSAPALHAQFVDAALKCETAEVVRAPFASLVSVLAACRDCKRAEVALVSATRESDGLHTLFDRVWRRELDESPRAFARRVLRGL